MKFLRGWFGAAVLALAGLPATSMATLVDSANNPLNFSWSQTVLGSDGLNHTLTGSGTMAIAGFNTSQLTLTITLNNTSDIGGQGGERLTSFGFGIDPNATSVSFSDAADSGLIGAGWASGALPANVQGVEVCAIGGQNCSGGGNGGIFANTSDTFQIMLGGNWGSSVNIDPIGFKYQTGYGSFEFPSGGGGGGGSLPEPSTTALMGLGLAVMGIALFRRRRQHAARPFAQLAMT
jgi:hypothetical protein